MGKEEKLNFFAKRENEDNVSIPNAKKRQNYPMSSNQKKIYLDQQMNPEITFYNMPVTFKITRNSEGKLELQSNDNIIMNGENQTENKN